MASLGLHRAIQLLPNNGITQAKKIADLLVKTNTDAKGDTTIEGLNQAIDSIIQSGYGSTIDGQRQVAAYTNKIRDLSQAKEAADNSLAALKLKEHAAWYVDNDQQMRDPAFVADNTSQSLDLLIAETVAVIQGKKGQNKDTSELETYLTDLVKRSDRMRNVSNALAAGQSGNLEGYGYYVDADPNTGKIRGASFMPTDVGLNDIGNGMTRTDTFVTVGGIKVPLYLPYIKDSSGQQISRMGNQEYMGNGTIMQAQGDNADLTSTVLKDESRFQFDGGNFQRGQVYRTFTGKTNIDGTPQEKYLYAGYDNKMYSFNSDDPTGKALIADLKSTGSLQSSSIPRINPYTAMSLASSPLPKDPSFLQGQTTGATRAIDYQKQIEQNAFFAKQREFQNSNFGRTLEGTSNFLNKGVEAVGNVVNSITSFFGRKNTPNKPEASAARTGNDVIAGGADTFNNRA